MKLLKIFGGMALVLLIASSAQAGQVVDPGISGGRLTLTSGTPVTSSDVTSAGTIYFTPYKGNKVALYDGSQWILFSFAERSLALSVAVDTNYDVFLYNNAGTLTLELSGWSNSAAGTSVRFASGTYASNLPTQDGVYVKSTNGTAIDATRRYVGTIRGSGSNVTEDSLLKRFVFNAENKVMRALEFVDTGNHSYNLGAYRYWNNSSNSSIQLVCGDSYTVVNTSFSFQMDYASTSQLVTVALDGNGTTPYIALSSCQAGANTAYYAFSGASLPVRPGIGYHLIGLIESSSGGNPVFYNGYLGGSCLM